MSDRAYYSERGGTSYSNRSLLSNACADTIQDSTEKKTLLKYQDLVSEHQNLDMQLGKNITQLHKVRGLLKDTQAEGDDVWLTESELDATITQIRLQKNDIEKKMLSLEQTPILQRVVNREKRLLMQRLVQKEQEALEQYQREKDAEAQLIIEQYERQRQEVLTKRQKQAEEREKQRQEEIKQIQVSGSYEKSNQHSNSLESFLKQKSITWGQFALVCSIIICIVLYTSFLFTAFSEEVDTYICYTTDTGECYHASYCQYLSQSRHQTTVYKATRNYRSCSRCNPCIEKYETTIVVRNYFLPALISVPTSVMVYLLMTRKKTNQ